ncbi:Pyridine nucleotide-disulphide oxidoreductase, putative [Brevundimonas sp. BAL3]|nr:Pyridine nucleotide-disulphide oxidoreductase, putative [Brevundimonas sp. BAL3]
MEKDVVIVGAGFAGLYLLYKLRAMGLSIVALEAGDDVGGTWYWNRYPGARCDVPSLQYSFSFSSELQQDWTWSEKYAAQPEILSYIQHVADRFDLRGLIRFETRVESAHFDDAANLWTVTTDTGQTYRARYCIMATGSLSAARLPDIEGIDGFEGRMLHTGRWPHDGVDFTGRRVGVIGTGSSAVQAIPKIAEQADRVVVFQRTPNFTVPARNGVLPDEAVAEWKQNYDERRAQARATRSAMLYDYGDRSALDVPEDERRAEMERRWAAGGTNFLYAFNDIMRDERSNAIVADFIREKIAATVKDPETVRKLTPRDYPVGAKRICVDTDYYDTFNRPNVYLADLRSEPIERITANAVVTAADTYEIDDLVLATGFDAMTGALSAIDIRGIEGERLREKWAAGPRTYLGLMTHGYPNLFIVNGPGSPSVLSNMVMSVEQNVDWIVDCIEAVGFDADARIDPVKDAEDNWVQHVNDVAAPTLYGSAASWYMGANVPGKPRVFMPYVGGWSNYVAKVRDVAAKGYEGFSLRGPAAD